MCPLKEKVKSISSKLKVERELWLVQVLRNRSSQKTWYSFKNHSYYTNSLLRPFQEKWLTQTRLFNLWFLQQITHFKMKWQIIQELRGGGCVCIFSLRLSFICKDLVESGFLLSLFFVFKQTPKVLQIYTSLPQERLQISRELINLSSPTNAYCSVW